MEKKISDPSIPVALTTSEYILKLSREINIYSTVVIVIFGLVGHLLTILVYSRKEFRTNSSHAYLLCLAINDGLFLITHLCKRFISNL